jgi:hypothetical protein
LDAIAEKIVFKIGWTEVLKRTSTLMSDERCTEWLLCKGYRILQLHMQKGETCYGDAEKLKVGEVVHES